MRLPVLIVGAIALSGCSERPTSSSAPAGPAPMAAFRVTHVETQIEGLRTEGTGPAAVRCGETKILLSFEEIGGVGARIVREETLVVEHDGGIQPGRAIDLDVAVRAGGRVSLTARWPFCGQPAVDFPAQLKALFTIRDDHGHEQVLTNGAVLVTL
jgi:hypothetical protein